MNIWDILILLALAAVIAAAVHRMLRGRKTGSCPGCASGCGGSCDRCGTGKREKGR